MAKLRIEQSHDLEHAEVKSRLDALQARLADKYGIKGSWTSDTDASVKGTGVHGTISCHHKSVAVTLDLSFPISMMKDKIETRVKQELAKVLTAPAGDSDGKPA